MTNAILADLETDTPLVTPTAENGANGFTSAQDKTLSERLQMLATKQEMYESAAGLRKDMYKSMVGLRKDLDKSMARLRKDLGKNMASLEQRLRDDIKSQGQQHSAEIRSLRKMTIWTLIFVAVLALSNYSDTLRNFVEIISLFRPSR